MKNWNLQWIQNNYLPPVFAISFMFMYANTLADLLVILHEALPKDSFAKDHLLKIKLLIVENGIRYFLKIKFSLVELVVIL